VTTPIQDEIFLVIVRVRLAAPASRGKSRAAKRVASRLNGDVISKEVYSLEMSHPFPEPPEKQNYDAPNGMDGQGPESHIRNHAAGNSIDAPIYDFGFCPETSIQWSAQTHSRQVDPDGGRQGFAFCAAAPHFDLSIYLEVPQEVCFRRRQIRAVHPAAVRSSKSLLDLELEHARPNKGGEKPQRGHWEQARSPRSATTPQESRVDRCTK
jgi:uridine kinase